MKELKYLRGDDAPEAWLQSVSHEHFVGVVPRWEEGWLSICLWYEDKQPRLVVAEHPDEVERYLAQDHLWFLVSAQTLAQGATYVG